MGDFSIIMIIFSAIDASSNVQFMEIGKYTVLFVCTVYGSKSLKVQYVRVARFLADITISDENRAVCCN